jgi:hypothetical protein
VRGMPAVDDVRRPSALSRGAARRLRLELPDPAASTDGAALFAPLLDEDPADRLERETLPVTSM